MDPHQEPLTPPPTPVTTQPMSMPVAVPLPPPTQPSALVTQAGPPTPPNPDSIHPSPGIIVLQWLTYAFWGWTVIAMSLLTGAVLANFIADSNTGGFTPYAIASVLVLLPISIICDIFYSKHELPKKTGAASIVFVIHAVLFSLFGIGALIAIVISLVTLFTSSSDTSGNQVALYTSIIVAVLYAAVLLRTLNPPRFPLVKRLFIIFMIVVVGIISLLGIVGPVAHERSTRHDRLIESNLSTINSGITGYANSNKRLPDSLSTLTLTGDAKKLIDANDIKYTANLKAATTVTTYNYNSPTSVKTTYVPPKTFYYQLCVTFTKASKPSAYSSYSSYNNTDLDGYISYLSVYNHPAGQTCYKLKTVVYNY